MSMSVWRRSWMRFPTVSPRMESGVELKILKKIFTGEEAEIACSLKLPPEAPEQIAERLGRKPADQLIQAPTDARSWMMERSMDTGKTLEKFI